VTNGCSVESEKKRTEDRSLWNASGKWSRARAMFSNGDVLGTVSKVGGDKGEGRFSKSKSRGESF
jgi:hypothetical protein